MSARAVSMTIGTVEVAPDRAADLEAVDPRQHDVEQHEIGRLGREPVEPGGPSSAVVDREARVPQADRGHFADRRVILDEQDPGVHAGEYARRSGRSRQVGRRSVRMGRVANAAARKATAIKPNTTGTPTGSPSCSITTPYSAVHSDPTPNASVKYSA